MKIERFYYDELKQRLAEEAQKTRERQARMTPEEQAAEDAHLRSGFQAVIDARNRREYIHDKNRTAAFLQAARTAFSLAKLLCLNVSVDTGEPGPATITLSAESIDLPNIVPEDLRNAFFAFLSAAGSFSIQADGSFVKILLSYDRFRILDA